MTAMGLTIHDGGPECPANLLVPMALGLADAAEETSMDEGEGKPMKTPEVPKMMRARPQMTSSGVAIKKCHPNHVFADGHASL